VEISSKTIASVAAFETKEHIISESIREGRERGDKNVDESV
jgi:hypothetical protein